MRRSGTGNGRQWGSRGLRATAALLVLGIGAFAYLPPAYAVEPPVIDPDAVPADSNPSPPAPMKQIAYCSEVGVLPETDFRVQPKYMNMLNLPEAWRFGRGAGVTVAVIDTGVTPHPRLPRLVGGGDYVMGGDGLSDCDGKGTIVASLIAAVPADEIAGLPPAPPRAPLPVPTVEPPRKPPPPQTVTVVPPPPPPPVAPPPPGAPPLPPGAPPPPPLEVPREPFIREEPLVDPPPAAGGAAYDRSAAGNDSNALTPGYSVGGQVVSVGYPHPAAPENPTPPPPPPLPPPDAFSGIAPDVDVISIRQASQAFGLKGMRSGDEDPQTQQKLDDIQTMAEAIVHAADMGAQVINISNVTCMSARHILDQAALGAAVRYAAVDKDAVIVVAAGDSAGQDCKQNPTYDPLHPNDPRNWDGVTTVVTPAWFSDYVLAVGAVDSDGHPMDKTNINGPWVSIAAPGTDIVSLSPRDDGLMNAIEDPDEPLLVPDGTTYSSAIVSGVAALVRAKFPQLTAHQVINRLERSARPPAEGVDNDVGYGVVDPVAALTWDIPVGPTAPPQRLSAPLDLPPPSAERDMTPVWVAAGGTAAVLLVAVVAFAGARLTQQSRRN